MQMSIPTVVSRIIVAKYQRQGLLSFLTDSLRDIATLRKCANSCDTACLIVSRHQILHGLFGFSLNLLQTSTENDNTPSISCTRTPNQPNNSHSAVSLIRSNYNLVDSMLQRRLSRQLPEPYYDESQSDHEEPEMQPSEAKELTTGPTQQPKDASTRHKLKRRRQKLRKQFINKRIVELENQIKGMTESQELCRRCQKLLALPHCLDLDNRKQTELQFEGFPIGRLQRLKQLKGQIWIVLGLFMLIVGVHLHGLEGGAHSYKLIQNDIKDFTQNIENSDDVATLPIYYEILDSQTESHSIMTVQRTQLMFQQSFDVSVRYDDLIQIMESLKGFFQSWHWM